MTNEINAMVSDRGEIPGAIVATGSVVSGDWVFSYQTATDDMFAAAVATANTVGSVAIARAAVGASNDKVIGIVQNNATSGQTTNVATEGLFIGVTAGQVTAGEKIMPLGQGIIDYNNDASGAGFIVGRALTGASAADKYVLFKLNL